MDILTGLYDPADATDATRVKDLDELMNQLAQVLRERVTWTSRGPLSQRPVIDLANPGDGRRVYIATDPVVIYQDVVVGWQPVAPPPPLLTTLPPAPYDGQEICFQTSGMATLGIVWRLRYRASAPAPYKWEYVGGPPVELRSSPSGAFPATVGSPGVNVDFTAPLAGEYECGASAYFDWNGGSAPVTFRTYPGFQAGTLFSSGSQGGLTASYPAFFGQVYAPPGKVRRAMSLGEIVRWAGEYQTNSAPATANTIRILTVLPVRVG